MTGMEKILQEKISSYGQANLARDAGISKGMVSHVMSGNRSFGKKNGLKIAVLLDIPFSIAIGAE